MPLEIQKEVLIYSAHPDITFGDLKNLKDSTCSITIDQLKKTQDIFIQNHISAFTLGTSKYHYKFHSVPSKPYIIHYVGDLSILDKNILAMVGPRKPSNYSNKILRKLFEHAQNYNLATISGMADGVDQTCHALSIKYNIPTIAVLGGGLNHFLNGPHRHIIQTIVDHGGLVISEYKLDFKPTKYSFPQRNRIIAGLGDVLFLPEAGEKSGSLITADFAYKIGRPVYTVPNDIFVSTSIGVNQLLSQDKAKLLLDFTQFFDDHFKKSGTNHMSHIQSLPLPAEQNQILKILSQENDLPLSSLIQKTRLNTDTIMQHITLLELQNYIYQNMPGRYKLC